MLKADCSIEPRTSRARRDRGSSLTLAMKRIVPLVCLVTGLFAAPVGKDLQRYLDDVPQAESVRFVCEVSRSGEKEQWLIAIGPSSRPIRSGEKSVSGVVALFQRSLLCSTGREYRFSDLPFAMDVQMVGPFSDVSGVHRPASETARAIGNAVYFDEGLFATAQLYERVLSSGREIPRLAFLFRARYSAERIASDRAKAEAAGLSVEDEREIARSAFALNQFGLVAGKVDGFRQLLGAVIDLPTILQGLYISIDWGQLKRVMDANGMAEDRFEAPITLQTKSRLSGTISFVRPRGPLKYCAGIVEAQFDRSGKAPGTTLKIWLCDDDAGRKRANKAPEPTPGSVTPRAPSR
jgi:hypothetical protein